MILVPRELRLAAERVARDSSFLLRQHGRIAGSAFFCGAALLLSIGTLSPKRYAASAVIAVNVPAAANAAVQDRSTKALLQQQKARIDWSAVASQFHPLSQPASHDLISPVAVATLQSQVLIEPVTASQLPAGSVRIRYEGADRDMVFGVADAVAEQFTRPVARVAESPAIKNDQPLYAPVILPDVPPQQASHTNATDTLAALSRRLQANSYQGKIIQEALNQNTLALDGLHDERAERERKVRANTPLVATPPRPAATKQISPQEERLHQDLAKGERELAALRERYTEEYPGIVSARDKVRDIQLDITRIAAATPARVLASKPQPSAEAPRTNITEPAAISRQIEELESVQIRLQGALNRNHAEALRLQSAINAAGSMQESTSVEQASPSLPAGQTPHVPASATEENATVSTSPTSAGSTVSPFFLVEHASVTTVPWFFAAPILWPFSVGLGFLVACLAAWIAERRDPSIRNEGMLRHELPASAVYLGRIPRIRHEVIAD